MASSFLSIKNEIKSNTSIPVFLHEFFLYRNQTFSDFFIIRHILCYQIPKISVNDCALSCEQAHAIPHNLLYLNQKKMSFQVKLSLFVPEQEPQRVLALPILTDSAFQPVNSLK